VARTGTTGPLQWLEPATLGLKTDRYNVLDLNRRLIYECRCDGILKSKDEGSTRLTYTGFDGGLEHLKIESRLIDERFVSVMGACDLEDIGVSSIFKTIRSSVAALARMLPISSEV
jgi:hypothetical protein